ncbi:MAG: thioredoxin domain-containing protein [Rhizobiales bacterium]|nr:thioredoxin domain-containing protein [Hyphomicrobiales bacterium]
MTANRLANETSPYLLQHKHNPVHWLSWGEDAFAAAKATDKPVLLSVGYAACHWCHVMAHESFENSAIANLMNQHFVCIKVDREERPDIDTIYMTALHALGEQGGWPLTMFLTPDAEPFWGGTYFPPEPRYGRPGFPQVLTEIARIWAAERGKVTINSNALKAALQELNAPAAHGALAPSAIPAAADAIVRTVDLNLGGLRGAPKFPQAPLFDFLWAAHCRYPANGYGKATLKTLERMSEGGIYDHLGGGLSRYSVDHLWLVPHFEKMLYDNAQFVALLTRAFLATASPLFRQRTEETVSFLLGRMSTADGAFASSYDADSEGEEGKYYVWTPPEIEVVLGADAPFFRAAYDVTPEGNWEGHSILNRLNRSVTVEEERRLAPLRRKLLAAREKRVPPGFDDKVLADWNGLAIAALAEAALVLDRNDWRETAERAFDRILELLEVGGELKQSYRAGKAQHRATAESYANLMAAALKLDATFADNRYLVIAERFANRMLEEFWDDANGGFFFTAVNANDLLVRTRTAADNATPNANGTMVANFAILAHLTGNESYRQRARAIVKAFSSVAAGNPFAAPSLLRGFMLLDDTVQVVAAADCSQELLATALKRTGLDVVLTKLTPGRALPSSHPAAGKPVHGDGIYVCRGNTCAAPARNDTELTQAFERLGL